MTGPTARVNLPVSLVSPANPVNRLENNRGNPVIKLANPVNNPVNNPAISRDNPVNPDREANPVDRAVAASPEAINPADRGVRRNRRWRH